MGITFRFTKGNKRSEFKLNPKTGAYVAGAATAVGLAWFLYNKFKDRIEFSIGPVPQIKLADIKKKEEHITEGRIEHLKRRIDEHGDITPAKLRNAVVDYVTEDFKDRLSEMDISRKALDLIVKQVHDKTEEILSMTDLSGIMKGSDSLESQVAAVIKEIKPQLIGEMKRIRHQSQ